MLKSINSAFDSIKTYVAPNDDDKNAETKRTGLIAASIIGASTIGAIYAVRQYYRARMHDNIPTIAPQDFSYFGGHLPKLIELNSEMMDWTYRATKELNWPPVTCLCVPGPQNYVFLNEPKLVKFCLDTHFADTPKGDDFIEEYEPLLGHGIFAANGEKWKFHRKVASRMFSMRNLKDFMYNISVKNTMIMIDKLKQLSSKEAEIDINDLLGRFTLDTFCQIAFGVRINSVETYPKKHEFGVAFDDLVNRVDKRGGDILWKIKSALNIGNEADIKRDNKIIMDFANKILDEKENGKGGGTAISDESGNKNYDILSLFLKHDPNLNREELRDIAMNFIIAGRDTTRMLLSWCLYELSLEKNKEVKQKLYEEIDGYNKNGKQPTYSDFVSGFRYLEGVLCESLRLWPSVPTIGRHCVKDIVLPVKDANGNNYIVRKGDHCLSSPYVTGRSPKIWGDDVLQFKPDRWKEKGINTYDQYTFTAFNINPRLCLGKQFAMTEAKVWMYNFLRTFNFEGCKDKKVKILPGAILNMETGLHLKLKPRD